MTIRKKKKKNAASAEKIHPIITGKHNRSTFFLNKQVFSGFMTFFCLQGHSGDLPLELSCNHQSQRGKSLSTIQLVRLFQVLAGNYPLVREDFHVSEGQICCNSCRQFTAFSFHKHISLHSQQVGSYLVQLAYLSCYSK